MQNSLDHAASHRSTNTTDIYKPPCPHRRSSAGVSCSGPTMCPAASTRPPEPRPPSPCGGSPGPTQPGGPPVSPPGGCEQHAPLHTESRGTLSILQPFRYETMPRRGAVSGLGLHIPIPGTLNRRVPLRHDPTEGACNGSCATGHWRCWRQGPGALLCSGAKEGGNLVLSAHCISSRAGSWGTDGGLRAEPVTCSAESSAAPGPRARAERGGTSLRGAWNARLLAALRIRAGSGDETWPLLFLVPDKKIICHRGAGWVSGVGFYRVSVSLSTRPGEQMCVLSPAEQNPPNTCSRRVPRPLSPRRHGGRKSQ